MNLIAVNWESSSHTLNYLGAANLVQPIGVYVAQLIDFLVDKKLASLDDIHVIGFSLGAHAAGYAGKNVKSGKLPKIVGYELFVVLRLRLLYIFKHYIYFCFIFSVLIQPGLFSRK